MYYTHLGSSSKGTALHMQLTYPKDSTTRSKNLHSEPTLIVFTHLLGWGFTFVLSQFSSFNNTTAAAHSVKTAISLQPVLHSLLLWPPIGLCVIMCSMVHLFFFLFLISEVDKPIVDLHVLQPKYSALFTSPNAHSVKIWATIQNGSLTFYTST